MVTGPHMEYDHVLLEREVGPAVGHTRYVQPTFGVEYPGDHDR